MLPGILLRRHGAVPNQRFIAAAQQHRHKHQKAHRMVDVKLLENIPGVGMKGSIQSVAPGRMRHVFYPQKAAAYILQDGATSRPKPKRTNPRNTDVVKIRSQLQSLGTIVFQRIVSASNNGLDASSSSNVRNIVTPVGASDVLWYFEAKHGISLREEPVYADVQFEDNLPNDRIDTTGTFPVTLHLSTNDIFKINVVVEPKIDIGVGNP